MPVDCNDAERKRKPRNEHAPYKPRKPKASANSNGSKSSAQPQKKQQRSNLTLYTSQDKIVKHFATRTEGVLIFDQSTLSRKLKERKTLEDRVNDHPNALSTKRIRLVTRPDVELALFLWVKHMEEKGESVNGSMLLAKRGAFEVKFNVPQEECLPGDGWLPKFKKAYNIKEFRRHGEAASVDIDAVNAERIRIKSILANYVPKNRFNFDETGFFAFAPPDRGLSTEQMSGKKRDKFRITMGIGCNADGTEKLPPVFIGKYANPRCFKKKKPEELGFFYRNNKTAWMTMVIFEEWLKALDIEMRRQNRKICLLVDNFSAHYVSYQPQNVRVEFFEPNLTSHVQPCDAGIIRTVKALYRKAFCLRAIDLDDAGEREIYKINLLEAILMVKEAWAQVSSSTIANCWNHTKIQPESNVESTTQPTPAPAPTITSPPMKNPKAWDQVRTFATSDGNITLPQAEDGLRNLLGEDYRDTDWQPVLKVVMDAERDMAKALEGVEKLAASYQTFPTSTETSNPSTAASVPSLPSKPNQLADAESKLSEAVKNLKNRNRIVGKALTLEEMLNPTEETEIGHSVCKFEGGDDEIVAHVNYEMAVRRGEVIEIDEDEDDDEGSHEMSFGSMIQLCAQMEIIALSYAEPELKLGLSQTLRKFRVQLRKMEGEKATQATLDRWF